MIGPILYRRQFCFLLASTWRHYSDASSFLCFFTQKFVGGLIPQSPPPPPPPARARIRTRLVRVHGLNTATPAAVIGLRVPQSPINTRGRQGSTDGARGQQMAPGVMATPWSLLHVYTIHRKGNYQCRDLGLIGSFLGVS